MRIMPGTRLGKWSVGLIVLFFLLFVLFNFLAASSRGTAANFTRNLSFAIPGIAAAASAICAFVTGLIAVFHRGEKGALVFVSLAIGLAVTLFVIGEFAFVH